MTTTNSPPFFPAGQQLSRHRLIQLLHTGLATKALRFTRQTALDWLGYFPGDLPVNLLYAQSLSQIGQYPAAVKVLENLCLADPEYEEAQQLYLTTRQMNGEASSRPEAEAEGSSAVFALGNNAVSQQSVSPLAVTLKEARQALARGEIAVSEERMHQVLLAEVSHPLIAITHLQVIARRTSVPKGTLPRTLQALAEHYHQRWPTCLLPMLLLADSLMDSGESERAVALLHRAVAHDVTGQVATRWWGTQHPYRALWPEKLEAPLEVIIPAEVAAAFGWNRLPQPMAPIPKKRNETHLPRASSRPTQCIPATATSHSTQVTPLTATARANRNGQPAASSAATSESLHSVQAELEKVAARLQKRHLARTEGRFPVYVVFTTRRGLAHHYGIQLPAIEAAMKRLVKAVAARPDWEAVLFIADDAASTKAFGMQPVQPDDPWKLKLALGDLDVVLGRRGQMIGAVLIVGGPEVVPFHNLPNPMEDADADVPSDNPYATRDENYFIPEWSVGRLPAGGNAEVLLQLLNEITARHAAVRPQSWFRRWQKRLMAWLSPKLGRSRSSWAYSAKVWLRASASVFRPIGEPQAITVSPPTKSEKPSQKATVAKKLLPTAKTFYINLHGVPDAGEWYGQRDISDPPSEPEYPIALRPEDIGSSDQTPPVSAPQVVFSEACYGANIKGKKVDDTIALKFLASGTQAVVGSTTTSYGSVDVPLIAADLLGKSFFKYLRDGMTAGEALRQAKVNLASEMERRQGFLDAEDQKTLISFILYGDPLAQPTELGVLPKGSLRPLEAYAVTPMALAKSTTVLSIPGSDFTSKAPAEILPPDAEIKPETLAQVKSMVEKYLPGMSNADITFGYEQIEGGGNGRLMKGQMSGMGGPMRRNIVTLSKQVKGPGRVHWHFARLTLDEQGKVIKMAVSR